MRNGADDVELLVVHAEADWSGRVKGYIDEIVCQRVKDRGWACVHQAERAQGGSVKDWNVTALTAMNGAVIERYWYKPYGEFVAAAESGWFDYDQDGDVDSTDAAVVGLGGACLGSSTQACQTMDADGDRDLDSADYTIISAYVSTLTADTKLQRVPAAPSSRRGNVFGHQGLLYDAEIMSNQNRARQYAPEAKRFMQRDPLVSDDPSMIGIVARGGYQDGQNLHAYLRNTPIRLTDPEGLSGGCCGSCTGVVAFVQPGGVGSTCSVSDWGDSLVRCTPCTGRCPCSCSDTPGTGAGGGCKGNCKICHKCQGGAWVLAQKRCGECTLDS